MTPLNAAVFKFVCASPVGKAMSDADREALRSTLETTDVRDVRGWLGEQVRKAAAAAVAKGDYEGHPFRGNQYADASGASTGGAGSTPKPRGGGGKPYKAEIKTMFSDKANKAATKALQRYIKNNPDIVKGFTTKDIQLIQEILSDEAGEEAYDSAVGENIVTELLRAGLRQGIMPTESTHPAISMKSPATQRIIAEETGGEPPSRRTAGGEPPSRDKGDAGTVRGRGNPFRSRSDDDLRNDADELAASIEELQGLGEIENDRGDTDRAKATLAEAKSRMKELKAIRVELERRARGPQDSETDDERKPSAPVDTKEKLQGAELKSLKSKTTALVKIIDRSSDVTSELGARLKDLQSKIDETPAGSEARKTGIRLLREASAAVKEAKGHLNDFDGLVQRTVNDPSLGNAVRLETSGVDLGEMFKGAARDAEYAMDQFETVLKFPTKPYMRSTSQISGSRGKAANDKFTNDTAAIQGAAEKPVRGISGKRRDDAFDAVQEEDDK